jgi:hypothetical protein
MNGKQLLKQSLDYMNGLLCHLVSPMPLQHLCVENVHILRTFIVKCVVVYLDDILIYSKSFDEHIYHFHQLIDVLRTKNLYRNIIKFSICTERVVFLGFVVSV